MKNRKTITWRYNRAVLTTTAKKLVIYANAVSLILNHILGRQKIYGTSIKLEAGIKKK